MQGRLDGVLFTTIGMTQLQLRRPDLSDPSSVDYRRRTGRGRWRKRKGIARFRLKHGGIHTAEVHWYEAHGIGRKEFKIKRILA
jgi:hypothetical protein